MNGLMIVMIAIITMLLSIAIPQPAKGVRIRFANFSDVADVDFTTTRAIYHSVRLQNTQTFDQYVLDHFAAPQVSQYFNFYVPPQAIHVEEAVLSSKQVSLNLTTPHLQDQHQYTVVLLGHKSNGSLKLIIIDETEAFKDVDWLKESPQIWINTVEGSSIIAVGDMPYTFSQRINYGDYQVIKFPVANGQIVTVRVTGNQGTAFFRQFATYEPNYYYLIGVSGKYFPNKNSGVIFSPIGSSTMSLVEWLQSYSNIDFTYKGSLLKFNTLLELLRMSDIDLNDLHDVTMNGSGIFLLAPTDQAFEKLPVGYLDALKQDPAKLRNMLLYHMLGRASCAASVDSFYQLATLHGALVSLEIKHGQAIYASDAHQIECWQMQKGVIAAIDSVLLPPELDS